MRGKIIAVFFVSVMLMALFSGGVFAQTSQDAEAQKTVTILFTHDFHSRLEDFRTGETSLGGLARISSVIKEKREEMPETFCLDGGDFSMGTLYQTVFESHAAELTMLGRAGYDVVTLGNHEYDYRARGLAGMLRSAVRNAAGDESLVLPRLVISNIDWNLNQDEEDLMLKESLEAYGAGEYVIVDKGGVRMGVFGIMGKDSERCAPESGIVFSDPIESAKATVGRLKEENVDMIVCLSHSGTWDDPKKSEDELLAKAVPEIDLIVSGHTHTYMEAPIQIGDTLVVSGGCYGQNLGEIRLVSGKEGRWDMDAFQLIPMSSEIPKDPEIETYLKEYKEAINTEYLSRFHFQMDQRLAANRISFEKSGELETSVRESRLGNLIADSYIHSIRQAEGDSYVPVDVAVVPSGIIRDTFDEGDVTVADVFNVSSLGIGKDRLPGYPLISCYLTGKELKTAAEIDASVSPMMDGTQLYASGMVWSFNPKRLILNRITGTGIVRDGDYEKKVEPIEDEKMYRVAADLYSAQMLSAVEDVSKGILKITPKDSEGTKITDYEAHIIYNDAGEELKAWYALANYLGDLGEVPARYGQNEGRKISQSSSNIIDILKNPNGIAWVIYIAAVVVLALCLGLIRLIYKKVKRYRRRTHGGNTVQEASD